MWHKPCRTFHPWCPCIKTRCLFPTVMLLFFLERRTKIQNFPMMTGTMTPMHYLQSETRVIIYANYRTGSTYTSEFLVKHNKSFFMFEPLVPRYVNVDNGEPVTVPTDILGDLLQCNIVSSTYRKFASNIWLTQWTFCHPDPARPACYRSKSPEQALSRAELVCKASTFKIIKVIRVNHLRDLAKFMTEGVKVIHLIRDPRGFITSQDHALRGTRRDKPMNYQKVVN